jgi:hypothetical protein
MIKGGRLMEISPGYKRRQQKRIRDSGTLEMRTFPITCHLRNNNYPRFSPFEARSAFYSPWFNIQFTRSMLSEPGGVLALRRIHMEADLLLERVVVEMI